MKLARVKTEAGIRYAQLRDGKALLLREAPYDGICQRRGTTAGTVRAGRAQRAEKHRGGRPHYRSHAEEIKMELTKEPLIFSKWISSMLDPEGTIIKPRVCKQLDYEAELAFVVKKEMQEVRRGDAAEYILGYTCLNDVTHATCRQWTASGALQGFDTFLSVRTVD